MPLCDLTDGSAFGTLAVSDGKRLGIFDSQHIATFFTTGLAGAIVLTGFSIKARLVAAIAATIPKLNILIFFILYQIDWGDYCKPGPPGAITSCTLLLR